MTAPYNFRSTEEKWQKFWETDQSFKAGKKPHLPKAYILEMLPYPSGRIHMGHVRNYTIGDAIARFKKMQGFDVLHPMGWDAFGLPAENAAMQHNTMPEAWTIQNIEDMKQQLKALGFAYDWDREIATCLPNYYAHEQKIFLDFYRKGLAYRKESWVNWDPVDGSVLANEQVVNGRGWRSGALVEKRKLTQWSIKITNYAEELLTDLPKLTGWPEKVVRMQENWIGKSEGALVKFKLENGQQLEIFTTRPETLFGAAFCGIAPTHPLAEELSKTNKELADFIADCQKTSTTEEALNTVEKKGLNTGLFALHPFNSEWKIPIYVANFVLMDYGTGAIFGCPAHDERDHEFAVKYNLPILPVVSDENRMINSEFLNRLSVDIAKATMLNALEEIKAGNRLTTYRLRDWCVSRQRYWGCPIPIIYCDRCGIVPVPTSDLPVKLPDHVDFSITGNPLENHPTWKHVDCPTCGKPSTRETDTFDTFFESSWYFLRYCNPNAKEAINKAECEKWMTVDWYIGGIEHAVMHLLYARFFIKALRDCGYLTFDEPFKNLLTQGMVCHQTFQDKEGNWLYPNEVIKNDAGQYTKSSTGALVTAGRSEKMSKSKRNLVDPQEIINSYGADVARIFIVSDNPPDRDFEWSDEGLDGSWRYLNRVWRIVNEALEPRPHQSNEATSLKLRKFTHQILVKMIDAYERNAFNKVLAFNRELTRFLEESLSLADSFSLKEAAMVVAQSLGPIAPHLCSELWQILGNKEPLVDALLIQPDPELAKQDEITIAVQVNGKLRGSFETSVDSTQEELESQALLLPAVVKETAEKTIKRIIVIPKRIVNIVV